ncbi:hypothetical protein HYS11_00450, partial [Candidatus Gottesmanbacteria bacterium]|nr:hypothetical protein [Candidatus Gottesmanbacteria bacterium]
IYNKTTNEKTFVKGTVLIGPKSLQFTLDSEVSVASVSDVFAGIAGKAQAKVTASAIGTEGNLPPSSDFAFKDFPVTSYAARNERALGGGTSREVQVVSKTDADSATKKLTEKLTNEARQSISSKLPSGRDLLPESIQTKMTKRVLSQEVGNEASQFETQLALKATATTYQKRDIEDLLRRELASLVPSDYSLDASTPAISVSSAKVDRDGNVTFQASVTAKLVPLLAKDDIKKSLVGKTLADVEKILRQTQGIVGYEVVFTKELPFIKKTMPKLAKNLNVEVQPR